MLFENDRDRALRRQNEWDEYRARATRHYDQVERDRIQREKDARYAHNVAIGQPWRNHIKAIVITTVLALTLGLWLVMGVALFLGVILKSFVPLVAIAGAVVTFVRRRRNAPWETLDLAAATGVLLMVPWALAMLMGTVLGANMTSVLVTLGCAGVAFTAVKFLPVRSWVLRLPIGKSTPPSI